jgi:hypothetical protein
MSNDYFTPEPTSFRNFIRKCKESPSKSLNFFHFCFVLFLPGTVLTKSLSAVFDPNLLTRGGWVTKKRSHPKWPLRQEVEHSLELLLLSL